MTIVANGVSTTLTQQQLENRLLAAANSLRGPVDPADFKSYVFPILFFKWISDSWDYEHEQAVADYGDDLTIEIENQDYHPFVIPDGCHWRDVHETSVLVGVKLNDALIRLQNANPDSLTGVFGDVNWANTDRLPEVALNNLMDVFHPIVLNRESVPGDMLGAAYEVLLKSYADDSGAKAGEFFTPREVVHLLVKILDPQPGDSIVDPACGSGGMLVETVNAVRSHGGDPRTLKLHGQEINLTTSAIAKMNLYLHNVEDFRIVRGDTFREPKLLDGDQLQKFDMVIANPPFSLQNWGEEAWHNDPYKRSFCGVPPAKNGDYAWIQHMIASMKAETGRVGVVMPHGVLFRGGKEGAIRKCILENDMLEAIISLPTNLFYSTSIPVSLLIFRSQKAAERKNHVLFVDAAERYLSGKNRNTMSEDDIAAIDSAYKVGVDPDGDGGINLRLVPLSEIAENRFDLSIGTYIKAAASEDIDVVAALADLRKSQESLTLSAALLSERLKAAGFDA
ncbi:type I restriction enzyme M protein [Arthrobacter sp. UYEF6]